VSLRKKVISVNKVVERIHYIHQHFQDPPLREMSISELDDQLLIGGLGSHTGPEVGVLLSDFFVTHVVACGRADQPHIKALHEAAKGSDFKLHLVEVADNEHEDLSTLFDDASHFIKAATEDDDMNRVLVCCREGASRSVTVLLAHLVLTRGVKLTEAFDAVAAVRWRLWPNMGFIYQLLKCGQVVDGDRKSTIRHIASHAIWATAKHNGKSLTLNEAVLAWDHTTGDDAARLEAAKLNVLGLGCASVRDVDDISEIERGIFIAGIGDKSADEIRKMLDEHQICRLVVCGNLEKDTHLSIYKALDGIDCHVCRLPQPDDLAAAEPAELDRAVSFVEVGTPVLVACSKGASRSVSVVMATLMKRGRSLLQAFNFVASKRWRLWPNWRLVEHLIARDTGDRDADEVMRHIGSYSAMATCMHNGQATTLDECYAAWDRRQLEKLAPEERFLAVKQDIMKVEDLSGYTLVERPEKRPKKR